MSHISNNHILCCPCCNWAMKPPDVHRICTSARQLQMVVLHGPHTTCAEHCRTQSWSATSIRDDFISIFSRFQEFGHIFFDGKIVQVWMSQSSILQNIAYFICHDLTKSSAQKLHVCRNIQAQAPSKCDTALNGLLNEFQRWSPGVAMSLVRVLVYWNILK